MHPPAVFFPLLLAVATSALCARSVGPADGNDGRFDAGNGALTDGAAGGRDGARFEDLRVEIRGLDAYAGRELHIALEDTSSGAVTQRDESTITGQTFTLTMPGAFDRSLSGMRLHLYVDVDSDGRCTGSDRSWTMTLVDDHQNSGVLSTQFSGSDAADSPTSCGVFPP